MEKLTGGVTHLRLKLEATVLVSEETVRQYIQQLKYQIQGRSLDLTALRVITVEGLASIAVLNFLCSQAKWVACVDLSLAYPCSPELVKVCVSQLSHLHELHLNFFPHRRCQPEAVARALALDASCPIEHLEVFGCENKLANRETVRHFYALPNLCRLAFHHFRDPVFTLVRKGFGLAQTWDAQEQAFTCRLSWSKEPSTGLQSLFVTRRSSVLHPSLKLHVGKGAKEHRQLDEGNRLKAHTVWGYVDHTQALAQVLNQVIRE